MTPNSNQPFPVCPGSLSSNLTFFGINVKPKKLFESNIFGSLSPKNVRFKLRDPDLVGIIEIFRNNLNAFWDFYHGNQHGCHMVQRRLWATGTWMETIHPRWKVWPLKDCKVTCSSKEQPMVRQWLVKMLSCTDWTKLRKGTVLTARNRSKMSANRRKVVSLSGTGYMFPVFTTPLRVPG